MFRVHDRFLRDYVPCNLILFLSPEESSSKFLMQVCETKEVKCEENNYGEKVNIK